MAYDLEEELEALPELEEELEGEDEMEEEAGLEGEGWLGAIGNVVGSLLGEEEGGFEDELEGEEELNPVRKIYSDAMMEHLGELASEAETEEEAAEHFLPLIGMAASKLLPVVARAVAPAAKRLIPRVARVVSKASPHLTKHIGKVARTLHRNPQTRHLLKVVPSIARHTVHSIAHQAARGRHVTPRTAVRTLARQARRVLTHPHHRRQALRHHHQLERRFHRHYAHGMARPHWGTRYGRPWFYGHGMVHPGAAHPGAVPHHAAGVAAPHVHPARRGVMAGGVCTCPACGSTGAAAPAYCRCCGQLLR